MGSRGKESAKSGGGASRNYQEVTDDKIFNDSVKDWNHSLTKSEKDTITDYTGDLYDPLNETLREYMDDADRVKIFTSDIKNLDSALSKFNLEQDIITYRGISGGVITELFGSSNITVEQFNSKYVGTVMSDKGFMSTSVSKIKASEFGGTHMLKINVPKGKGRGAYVKSLSQYEGEKEFLMTRNSKLKITGASRDAQTGVMVISVDLMT